MLRRLSIALLLLLVLSGAAFAQQSTSSCFIANVGVPYTCDLGQLFGLNQLVSLFSTLGDGIDLSFSFSLGSASAQIPGITVSPDGVLSGTPTATGTFTVNLVLTEKLVIMGQTLVDQGFPFPFDIFVQGTTEGMTVVNPTGLTFSFNQGDTTASSQTITIDNRRSQAIAFTASASTSSGTNWLSISPSAGTVPPFGTASLQATATPSGLPPGTYPGNISITIAGGESLSIPVVATVTGTQGGIRVSQSGLLFKAVQGGGSPPSQSVEVLTVGSGTVNFTATATTISGGDWLSVSPASGTASPSSRGSVTFSIAPAGLAPGTYYGEGQITSENTKDSPEVVSIVLNIFPVTKSPGPSVSTSGLIFVAQASGQAPAAKNVVVTNPSPNPLTVAVTSFSNTGGMFFTVQPISGSISGQPFPISVQPVITGLADGVYTGELALTFVDSVTKLPYQRRIAILLIVVPAAGGAAGGLSAAPMAAACKPTKLLPVSTGLGNLFLVSAGWPQSLEVTVVDDCGTYLTTGGSVVATFSSGDPALPLTSLGDGRWTATWNPQNTAGGQVTISVQAQEIQPALQGSSGLGGSLQANPGVPIVSAGGVVSAASYVPHQPIGPGSFISIYGSALSQGTNVSTSLPFATNLGGTVATLGGKILPLYYTTAGNIAAIVPFNVPVNTTKQLVVQMNGALSVPVPVVLSTAQPAVFTQNQQGTGLGVIFGYKSKAHGGGAPFLIGNSHPVSAGDTLAIYATGLGPVDQPVAAGSAGPSSPLAHTVNSVTATVGGKTAQVVFAGLVPGAVVYQVNVVVPQGVTPGNSVPVVLTVAGLQSTPVTIVVK